LKCTDKRTYKIVNPPFLFSFEDEKVISVPLVSLKREIRGIFFKITYRGII